MPRPDEKFLVSLKGSPVAQYHQDIIIWLRRAVSAEVEEKNEYQSLEITNMPKNISTFKKEVLKRLRINENHGADYRLRKITYDGLFKIEHDMTMMFVICCSCSYPCVYYNFTKFHQNRMKNKKVLLIACFSVQNFKVSVES